jgi:hypothetical protein
VTHYIHVGKKPLPRFLVYTEKCVAWPVDFAISLSAFVPAIHGLRNLIDLAISSPRQVAPKVLFTSTVGVMSGETLRLNLKGLHD